MKCGLVIAALAATLAMPVAASEKVHPAVNANTKDSFAAVSTWVHKEMENGGRYAHLASSERERVDGKLTEMGQLLDQHGAVEQMSDADKTKMFNDQEEVNALLASRDGDRLICKSIAPVGSHRPVKTCVTAREMEQESRGAQKMISDKAAARTQRNGN